MSDENEVIGLPAFSNNKTSKIRGLWLNPKNGIWKAQCQINGKRYCNTFTKKESAVKWLNQKKREQLEERAKPKCAILDDTSS